MAYRVELSARARKDLAEIASWIAVEITEKAEAWFLGLEGTILRLAELPERGAQLPRQPQYRQLLYGAARRRYRVLYRVEQRSRTVLIVHVRHGARSGSGV